jgi:hypothetical protein
MLRFAFLLVLFFAGVHAEDYVKPEHVQQHIWEALQPHFLPNDHPIKARLDSIFSKRVNRNVLSLETAGFTTPKPGKYSNTVVSKHPKLKGYIVKLYTESEPVNDGFELLLRIKGAQIARDLIARYGYESYFEVPEKWIYPLPASVEGKGPHRKSFVLIAEDMGLMHKSENQYWFKTDFISKEILDALYTIVQEGGLDDSILPFNIPITKNGKLAFIDTAVFHRWPIRFYMLTQYLSSSKQKYWKKLIKQNGPRKV